MAERADVTSVEALEFFRTSLVIYLEKANQALNEVSDEVKRTRQWLEFDQRTHWEGERRRCGRRLDQAKQELYSARISKVHDVTAARKHAVNKAQRALDEVDLKIRALKGWIRNYDSLVGPRAKKIESLRFLFTHDMGKAVGLLSKTVDSLADYADLMGGSKSSSASTAPPPAQGDEDEEGGGRDSAETTNTTET